MMAVVHLTSWSILIFVLPKTQAFTELPKFNQLLLLYPGYHLQGGNFRNRDIATLVGGNHTNPIRNLHNTSPLRMSLALNRYGGRHAIGHEVIHSDDSEIASIPGVDSQQYIFENTAFGPYLAGKYGNPMMEKPNKHDASLTMEPFHQKQGIVRFVSYHKDHAGGHIGLWDCDHFFQSPDWSMEHHLISVEFWETPDSYCAPKDPSLDLFQILQKYRLVPRTTPPSDDGRHRTQSWDERMSSRNENLPDGNGHKVRHHARLRKRHRFKELWQRH